MDAIDKAGSVADVARLAPSSSTQAGLQPVALPPTATDTAPATLNAVSLLSVLAEATPPFDSKKVAAIQSLIASGAYPIDTHAIAAKMLALDFPASGADADA